MEHTGDPVPEPVRSGALRFARYALAPNRLGYCGPNDDSALFEQAMALTGKDEGNTETAGHFVGGHYRGADVVGGLRELAHGFEGAWPYLELIAEANGISDPLDDRVVSAYWLGGRGLDRVTALAAGKHATIRFRPRAGMQWSHVHAALEPGAAPSHAFHVMVVGPWIGMLRGGVTEAPLGVLNSCRVRRGRVLSVEGDTATVATDRVVFGNGQLMLSEETTEVLAVRLGEAGQHPCGPVQTADTVSIHWDWVCEVIDARTWRAIGIAEQRALSRANLALGAGASPQLG
ncbi:MAG: DUF6390 family protein [Microthrixaceae bacterium]